MRSDEELYDAFASLAMSGDGPGALAFAQELMAQGNINGCRFMIALYFNGAGVEEDLARDFELMYEAAEDGDPLVQFELGVPVCGRRSRGAERRALRVLDAPGRRRATHAVALPRQR